MSGNKLERDFQASLIKELKNRFEGCMVLKLDPSSPGIPQGIPDLLILFKNKWAALECKKSKKASKRPNQKYYVDKMNEMSYSSFIYPENREEILDGLAQAFRD